MNNCMKLPILYFDSHICSNNSNHSNNNNNTFIRGHMIFRGQPRRNSSGHDIEHDGTYWISARSLKDICKLNMVTDMDGYLNRWTLTDIPESLIKELLTEAILQRELSTIAHLVSDWPETMMSVKQLLPKQEIPIPKNFLTEPLIEQTHRSNILDAFIRGLLTRKKLCHLKMIDFRGFEDDRRLSIELSRIPALWLAVEKRNDLRIFSHLSRLIKLKQLDYLHRYFKKIATIYANVEGDFNKDQKFEEVVIYFDCHLMADEIAVGLSLVSMTPFTFASSKLWVSDLQDIYLSPANLIQIFDPSKITHFQLENSKIHYDSEVVNSSFQWVRSLRNLDTFSFPGSFVSEELGSQISMALKGLNQSIISLRYLQKLNLSRSCLKNRLRIILTGVSQPLVYLNLQDCSLQIDDLEFLIYSWRPFPYVKELNLSRNNFSEIPDRILKALVARTVLYGHLVNLSLAYCSIPGQKLCKCLRLIGKMIMSPLITPDRKFPPAPKFKFDSKAKAKCQSVSDDDDDSEVIALRLLCIQNFTPLQPDLLHHILYLSCQLPSLRRLQILPEVLYAFPGDNDQERYQSKTELIDSCHSYLNQLGRPDLTVV